jgi:hypothetical protein
MTVTLLLRPRTLLRALLLPALLLCGSAFAQERFSLFVPSPQATVERMIAIARLQPGDVVIDLGSGDGRIVLAAARQHPAIRGWGVDINADLVRQSNAAAQEQGLAERVQFFHRNVFDTDLREATVINMWLFPELMRLLRPKILAEARPGTRVISNGFDWGGWAPDETDTESGRVLKWIVPARVAGYWSWESNIGGAMLAYDAILEQRFQQVEGVVRAGNRRGVLTSARLRGEELSMTLDITLESGAVTRHEFSGRVRGERIEGSVTVTRDGDRLVQPWSAQRVRDRASFWRPTGVGVK